MPIIERSFRNQEYNNPNNPPWQKLLWVKQNYPDNYVDSTFLDELQRNVNVRTYDYWTMVYESGVITQHLSSVVIFIAIFIYLQLHSITGYNLIWTGSFLTGIGYIFWDLIMLKTRSNYEFKRKRVAKSAFFFFITLLGLSPILKTLTSQISDDTIWALTVICFLINVLFHDYKTSTTNTMKGGRCKREFLAHNFLHYKTASLNRIPGSLSTNAAIFASVLLASRLDTNYDVFGLLSFAVEWFSLFPIFRRHLRDLKPGIQIGLTATMLLTCVLMFLKISKAVVFIYILGFSFLTFICPYWLIFIQKYKNEIHGPWDEARPRLQRTRRNVYRKRTVTTNSAAPPPPTTTTTNVNSAPSNNNTKSG
ncbi:phosphatidylinositol N-acetylglucosaminyltransferase subunit C [Mycotypha africana]|uniref:phosphatidylinositol N-acetylglucosaminyltransferase subunit C n=1 Tax=Mycotypha africana TaxID=64632 RepID=UPI002301A9B5|nr:phosphatidylinositol N-acetylglucosaminyltransferase subunit C [Mycotypha africana]KAI8979330.1 phosphatidylinositol N-acetylglucosaminyltransferase subunit C [Mycotypha africana]